MESIYRTIIDKSTFQKYPNGYCFFSDNEKSPVNKLKELQDIIGYPISKAKGWIGIKNKQLIINGELGLIIPDGQEVKVKWQK